MPAAESLARAELREVVLATPDEDTHEVDPKVVVPTQFNPESLRVSLQNNSRGQEQPAGAAVQHVARGTTRLSVTLWFDVTVNTSSKDVRRETEKVAYFLQPKDDGAPPGVRFVWGSFLFDGVVDSMEETLEYFSPDGYPLRAQVGLTLSSPGIQYQFPPQDREQTTGAQRTTPVREGESVQQATTRAGRSPSSWRDAAAANDIDNPRFPTPGTALRIPGGR